MYGFVYIIHGEIILQLEEKVSSKVMKKFFDNDHYLAA
jgi:hypothetical protein